MAGRTAMALALAFHGATERVARALDGSGHLEVVVDDGVLTLAAQDVALADVLAAIGERAGFEVSVEGDADTPVSVVLADVPVEEAVRLILRERSSAFLYQAASEGAARRLAKVRVFAFQEDVPQLARDRVAAFEPEAPVASDEPMSGDDEPAPLISPYDPREERLQFVRKEARGSRPTSAEDLITLLLEDRDADVRGLAAVALGRLGGGEAGEALAEALSDRSLWVRRRAARALGEAWGGQAVEPLAELLMAERARTVRRVAAYTLGRIDGEAALDALEPLQFDPDARVRRIAILALERAGD